MWKVRLFKDTGFNLINVPDDPSLLEQKPHKSFGVIDCLQRYFLSYITIRAYEDDVILGDFLKLYDDENENKYAYYVVNGYTMTSGDTVRLDVAMEPLLTCGGIDNITIVDGMTSRHHLAAGEDLPFEEDPLLVPKKVYLKPVATFFDGLSNKKTRLIVRSVISGSKLSGIATAELEDLLQHAVNLEATYDPDTGDIASYAGYLCSTSAMDFGTDSDPTEIEFNDYNGDTEAASSAPKKNVSEGTHYIVVSNTTAQGYKDLCDAVKKCVEFGREDIILDAYFIPDMFYTDDDALEVSGGSNLLDVSKIHNALHRDLGNNPLMSEVASTSYKVLPDYGAKKPSDWHNKRILFGSNFAYTFVSPDNNSKLVINPEDLYNKNVDYDVDPEPWEPGQTVDETPEQFPRVLVSFDLRPGGNITFEVMPASYEMNDIEGLSSADDRVSPFIISTGNWDDASITSSAVAGGALKARSHALSSFMKDEATDVQMRYDIENKSRGLRALNPFADFSTGVHRGYYMGDRGGGAFDPATNMGMSSKKVTYNNMSGLGSRADAYVGATTGNEYDKARYDRISQRMQENMEFANAMVPKTQVVSKADGSALMNGMGLLVYRSFVSEEDLEKFDQILNKYGCKHTTQLTKDMLTNRPRFNYIETQGVSIKCPTVPKSVRDELANAFNTGLRIWHVKDVNVNVWNDPVEEES